MHVFEVEKNNRTTKQRYSDISFVSADNLEHAGAFYGVKMRNFLYRFTKNSHVHLSDMWAQQSNNQLMHLSEKKKKSDLFGVCCSVQE